MGIKVTPISTVPT